MRATRHLGLGLPALAVGLAVVGTLVLGGCAPGSPNIVYYGLGSLEGEASAGASAARPQLTLGIGPIEVPEYLNKSQIVTRQGDRSYAFNEFHRWASRLEKNIARVLGNNLGVLLETDRIGLFPWMSYFKPDYRILVEVIQFDSDLEGDAVLSVRWVLTDRLGKTALASGKNTYRAALAEPTYSALVEAESRLLEQLSRKLADEVRRLLPRPGNG